MESHISAREAAETFPEMIERVRSCGDTYVVEREGQPICRIEPIAPPRGTLRDLVRLLQAAPRPDAAYLEAVEDAARSQPTIPEPPWES